MARLPKVGGDTGTWGQVLNDYLSVSHETSGTLKANTVDTSQIKDNAITSQKLADDAVTVSKIAGAGQANGIATLGGDGKVPSSQLPAVSLNEIFTIESEEAMLELDATRGDMAIRTDIGQTYILAEDDPSVLENWIELNSQSAVTSVAGKTGAVSLNKSDVGLGNVDNTADMDKPVSTAVASALAGKADSSHDHDSDYAALAHSHDDRYFTEAEVTSALSGKLDSSEKGAVSGLATLDGSGKLTDAQIPDRLTETELNDTYASKTAVPVSVDDYGAEGDGVSDDTAAIQAAIDAMQSGSTLYFGRGKVYLHTGTIIVPSTLSDITIDLQGSTLKHGGSSAALTNKTMDNAQGYGAGGNNWTFKNGTIRGDYSSGYNCILNFHHNTGLRFENILFTEGMNGGHYIDLMGCLDVYVEKCTFAGAAYNSGAENAEAIQIDISAYVSSSAKPIENTAAYDGLPTRRVWVRGNRFTLSDIGGTIYPMPNPIGSHTAALTDDDTGYYQDIWFEDNYIEGYRPCPSSSSVSQRGWLRFIGARDVWVRNNIFRFAGPSEDVSETVETDIVILIEPTANVIGSGQVTEASPSLTSHVRGSIRITIEGNRFLGFADYPSLPTAYLIHLYNTGNINCVVRGNFAEDLPMDGLYATNVTGLEFSGNVLGIREGKRGIAWGAGNSAKVFDNRITFEDTTGIGISCRSGLEHQIQRNYIVRGDIGIDVRTTTTYSMITDNRIEGYGTAGIKVGDASAGGNANDILISSNMIKTITELQATANAIWIGPAVNRARRFGNQCRGGGSISDSGSGTITDATDQSS